MQNKNKPFVIFLIGPTAAGKTDFLFSIYKYLSIDVISVDSALIYKNMDIGTAKPTHHQLEIIPHKLINIKDPSENYSIFEFKKDVMIEINSIIKSGRIPFLVGGTMLYYHILIYGLHFLPSKSESFRKKIYNFIKKNNRSNIIHSFLKKVDPISADNIHVNDHIRLVRCLEIYFLTGNPASILKKKKCIFPYRIIQFGLVTMNRELSYRNITNRFEQMLKLGFEEEVFKLFQRKDLGIHLPSIRSVGYFQMWKYLNGEINYFEMKNQAIYATCHLFKKQMTWLRNWKNINFLSSENKNLSVKTILTILHKLNKNLN
ncbi:tRNA (adenosine(37)-N6)-dimethylallyltransferase MiaA [Buchnera aphidicola (Kurisakia onigurumii)]